MADSFQTYLFSYRYGGSEWILEILARSPEEAKHRVEALHFARYEGELKARIPARVGWIAKLYVGVRNRLDALRRERGGG